jgi:sporulation integral membrane protein YtvI
LEFQELSWRARGRLWLRLLIRVALAVTFLLLFFNIGIPVLSFCMPFVLGWIFAWLMEPLVRFLIKKTILSRKAVSILLILVICGILGGAIGWFIYKIFVEVSALSNNWNVIWNEISTAFIQLYDLSSKFIAYLPPQMQNVAQTLINQLMDWVKDLGTASLIPKTTSFAIKIPSIALSLVFFLMSLYFMMADYPRIGAVVTDWMPVNLKAFLRFLAKTFQAAFSGYIRAELLLSIVVFFILVAGFSLMRLPYALLLAFVLAVLDFIPIIGAGTVMLPWAVVCMILGDWKTAVSFLFIWGIIAIFRRIAEPRFLGSQTGLHPVLSLLSIYVGMKAFGVLGMILAPTLLLVAISVCACGVFDAFVDDVSVAFQDIRVFLQHKRKNKDST